MLYQHHRYSMHSIIITNFLAISDSFIFFVSMEIYSISMVDDHLAFVQSLQLILILKQSMSRNYDRFVEKQNQYVHDISYKNKISLTPSTNKALRKKIDDNIVSKEDQKYARLDKYAEQSMKNRQKQKESGAFREINQNTNNRKQNARTRGFDIHVTNIENINDKISSLLGMIKKDKTNIQKSQKDRQRSFIKENQSSPNVNLIDRIKKEKLISPFDKEKLNDKSQNVKKIVKDDQIIDRQRSTNKIKGFNCLNVVQEQIKQKQESNNYRVRYIYDEQVKRDYSNNRFKKSNQNQIKKSNWRENILKEAISITQNPIINDSNLKLYKKIENRAQKYGQQNIRRQAKVCDINELFEQRRNQRIRNRNQQNLKFLKSMKQEVSQGQKIDQYELNNSINYKQRKNSNSIYQALSQQTFEEIFPQQIQKMNYNDTLPSNFTKEGNNRTQKINSTTKLIDEQIRRIKSKIQESENNNTKLKQKFRQNKQEQNENKNGQMSPSKSRYQRSSPARRQKQWISRMAYKLSDQVEIDLRFKNARQVFEKINDQKKWEQLKLQTDKRGLKIMKMAPDQHNPFGNTKGLELNIQKIAQLLCEAQENWQNFVCNCVSSKNLKQQQFEISDLDLNKKGYLNIEDIVCFINLYSGQFYRNRDISLIFRRLQIQSGETGSKLSYSNFLKVFLT